MISERREILLVGMYEAREVPAGWQHPKDEHDTFSPLLPYGYAGDDSEILVTPENTMPPTPWVGEIEIMAYEICTEGTPISPAFPNTRAGKLDLCNWCAANEKLLGKHPVDGEAWAAILFGDAGITLDGEVRG
jgi:hypothetical protein